MLLFAGSTASKDPETLYKRFLEDKASLTVEEKKLLASWLKEQRSEYYNALLELEEPKQFFRSCSWAPYCDKGARECGGWTRDKCKYHKNFILPDFEAVMKKHRDQKKSSFLPGSYIKKEGIGPGE